LRAGGQVGPADGQFITGLYLPDAHLLEEVLYRVQFSLERRRFIVHGDDNFRLKLPDNLGAHGGVNRRYAAHRQQQYVDIPDFLDLFRGKDVPEVAQVTYRYTIDFYEVDRILAPGLPPHGIMEGGDADYQDTADFVFAGAADYPRLAADAFGIRVRRVLVTYRNDISGLLAERIAEVRGEGVGNDNGLVALNSEARMSQPVYIHAINVSQAASGVKKRFI
jgi:hypothetical protein